MAVLHRDIKLKWVARLHFWVMFFSFFLYLGLSFTLGPQFLYEDIRKKFFVFADELIVVTAVVPGPPIAPVITATPTCVGLVPRIVLDWGDDTGTTSWDIDRDSLPLTTGLTVSQYTDTAVVANTAYSYQITAYGPMSPGSATSTVSAATLDCASIAPVTVLIETLGGKNVRPENRANTDLSKRRPKVTGTTNTPNAIIDIALTNPVIRARTLANANGYFEWIPPIAIDTGNHILSVTATDPADDSRTGSDTLSFWTKNMENDESGAGSGEADNGAGRPGEPFDFSVTVLNEGAEAFQEDLLRVQVTPGRSGFPGDASGQLVISDSARVDAFIFSENFILQGMEGLTLEVPLPIYLTPGEYRIRADIATDGETVSREAAFQLKGLPFLNIGNRTISYSEAASYIGIIFFSLLFSFLFTLLLFVREYWLYLHSLRAITARHLARLGLLGTRKGVIR